MCSLMSGPPQIAVSATDYPALGALSSITPFLRAIFFTQQLLPLPTAKQTQLPCAYLYGLRDVSECSWSSCLAHSSQSFAVTYAASIPLMTRSRCHRSLLYVEPKSSFLCLLLFGTTSFLCSCTD